MNIFVGNLSFDASEADLKNLFEGFGNVASVAIVTRKEKKAPKSRGFGFVEIPDEQQALSALAALNGREFMGRVLNISPARPKTETQPLSKRLAFPGHNVRNEPGSRQRLLDGREKDERVRPSGQPETYNGGRRTRSYMKRRGLAGIQEEAKPRRNKYDNPMRWRKRGEQPRPWEKIPAEHKPRKEAEQGARPWKKPAAEANPGSKSRARPQKPRFNPSTSLGMVQRNGERSRTKSRREPWRRAAPGRKEAPAG